MYEPKSVLERPKSQPGDSDSVPPIVWLAFVSAFITTVSFYVIPVQLPFFLQRLEGVSGNKVGLALGSLPFAQAIASFFYKQVKMKLDFISIYMLGFIPMAVGFCIIGFSALYWQVIVGVMACGLGVGLLIPNGNLWVISLVPVHVRGKYIGLLTTATFLRMFFSPMIIQPIQKIVGMNTSFYVLGIALASLTVLYFLTRRQTLRIATN
ncbi:MFS transporter [Mangrovibacterium lignilyticum]|uniref:MFS transporter n=1 Tax=Mangrovibacterium lignilyticum TaxID=2668052 RepID=UPI0013D13E9D|nr:MFS transporter [Mangrovibacterium lignilyticum]